MHLLYKVQNCTTNSIKSLQAFITNEITTNMWKNIQNFQWKLPMVLKHLGMYNIKHKILTEHIYLYLMFDVPQGTNSPVSRSKMLHILGQLLHKCQLV